MPPRNGSEPELGHVVKPLPLGAQVVFPRGSSFRVLDQRSQLGDVRSCRAGIPRELLVPTPGGSKRAPRDAASAATVLLRVAAEAVEHVELIRRSCESPLLELARHRDQTFCGSRQILPGYRAAPCVCARAPVAEYAPGKDETRLVHRAQLCEHGQLLVIEESFGHVQLRLDVCLAARRPDSGRVTA